MQPRKAVRGAIACGCAEAHEIPGDFQEPSRALDR
jgi:hypothetical protein